MRISMVAVIGLVGLSLSACISNPNTLALGTLGAGGGGYAGSLFGKGQGKILATAGGTALGGLLGAFVGQKFDQTNQNAQSINSLYQRQSTGHSAPAPIVYQVPAPQYHQPQPSTYNVPMTCQVINNQVRCNGQ